MTDKKNKTVSFRIHEDKFNNLKDIAERKDIPLSGVFRDYVDELIAHDGKLRLVPEHEVIESGSPEEFPPTVEVPKSLIREHERLELENEHLRDQLQEYKQYVQHLESNQESDEDEIVRLEEVDAQNGSTFLTE